jgi:hypothetical protein
MWGQRCRIDVLLLLTEVIVIQSRGIVRGKIIELEAVLPYAEGSFVKSSLNLKTCLSRLVRLLLSDRSCTNHRISRQRI